MTIAYAIEDGTITFSEFVDGKTIEVMFYRDDVEAFRSAFLLCWNHETRREELRWSAITAIEDVYYQGLDFEEDDEFSEVADEEWCW